MKKKELAERVFMLKLVSGDNMIGIVMERTADEYLVLNPLNFDYVDDGNPLPGLVFYSAVPFTNYTTLAIPTKNIVYESKTNQLLTDIFFEHAYEIDSMNTVYEQVYYERKYGKKEETTLH